MKTTYRISSLSTVAGLPTPGRNFGYFSTVTANRRQVWESGVHATLDAANAAAEQWIEQHTNSKQRC